MPRRNRVTPFGEIIACPERGTFMGNRGILHDERGDVRRAWQVRRWLICVLEFRGRHRTIMAPNRYTELFFLDEATALAAGHRPCFECRRARFLAFRAAWAKGNYTGSDPGTTRAAAIDDRLHDERLGSDRSKRTYRADLDELPDGVFIAPDGPVGDAFLVQGHSLFAWSPSGYRGPLPRPRGIVVSTLTPRSTVHAIQAGYKPDAHPTCRER
jgi:hypothetical protein